MQVLLAGATGAIGRPLIRALTANGHKVSALVRTPNANPLVRELGAAPITADVLDREALLRAVDGLRADAVIHQATALRDAKMQLASTPGSMSRTRPPRPSPHSNAVHPAAPTTSPTTIRSPGRSSSRRSPAATGLRARSACPRG
ncbi:SDR family oxidoreductase [Nocardia salmonicida]|uniref:SDR family oxidoreductase n=1 Tax=Nocardia salmonicida TaxID=53431 RepID=UPI000A7AC3ED|nr:NAD-dependent epimerase/dehydratase family protein [Nocardia salmonicida]